MAKKLMLNLILGLAMLISIVNGATFYDPVQFEFSDAKPAHLKAMAFECQNSGCTIATPADVEYYKGDSVSCWIDYQNNPNMATFNTCMESFKLPGNTLDLYDCSTIGDGCSGPVNLFIKYDTTSPFGYIDYFFTEGDTYIPKYLRINSFNCEFDTCFNVYPFQFTYNKIEYAVSEIGQLNVKNIDNELLPIQVNIPVTIEETVCSAYRFANNFYKPTPPVGYDDFQANTKVSLDITRMSDGSNLLSQAITVPIEADTCAGLAAFSWRPSADLENEGVKFRVETEVIDNQVKTSGIDWAELIEVIYPENLDNACWTRSYDFTLSNIPSTELTTSVAQISEGEYLYANFNAGAWRDNSMTPMNFAAKVYFNDELAFSQIFATTSSDLTSYSVDLSPYTENLAPGFYTVKLVTEPFGSGCLISTPVEQTQNLQIYNVETFNVNFIVRSPNMELLSGANVNFELISEDNYFQNPHVYNQDKLTNNNGLAAFTGVFRGNYTYEVTMPGYVSVSNDVQVGSDTTLYITLPVGNSAPVINLPDELTQYYQNPIEFNIRDYVTDFNDHISDLTFTHEIISGNGNVNFDGQIYTITTTTPNTVVLKITATDPQGLSATDSMNLIFFDNEMPVINTFEAQPDNGAAPFNTNFAISVSDADGDQLECTIEFGDGTQSSASCNNLNGISHSYTLPGTYNAVLTANDGTFETKAYEQVFVFEREYSSPHINYFNLVSSNDNYLPTDLTFSWSITHPDNLQMECSLRVNGIETPVNCINNNYVINNYNQIGLGKFTLIATDSLNNQVLRTIEKTFEVPVIQIDFNLIDSSNGNLVPTDLTFNWQVTHPIANNDMTCSLIVNGVSTPVECTNLNYLINNYNKTGLGTFTLVAQDGNNIASKTIERTFEAPSIQLDYFHLIDSSNGFLVPTDLTFIWQVTHPIANNDMTCSLIVNGVSTPVECTNFNYVISNYNKTGLGTFTLVAQEGNNIVSKTIEVTFFEPEEVDLPLENVKLIMDDVIVPGEFEFNLETLNETLGLRQLHVTPIIDCNGIDNHLNNVNQRLTSSADSTNEQEEGFRFNFRTDTQDFKLEVPTDIVCIFKVRLQDDYGTDITIIKNIEFKYPVQEQKLTSIRGKGTDIMNYMSTTLQQSIHPGYNTIEFRISNNEAFDKDLSISMISQDLKIQNYEEIKLKTGSQRTITIPLYINQNTEPGLYPVRFAVNDGKDKQVRYSYIRVD